mmetsp:Transcript_2300/g.7919  ORF Transcript_2300/g.7919 Transcript_2300/m.7919 type:complete len:101 (+) Transcript_2300:1796-2098(+)
MAVGTSIASASRARGNGARGAVTKVLIAKILASNRSGSQETDWNWVTWMDRSTSSGCKKKVCVPPPTVYPSGREEGMDRQTRMGLTNQNELWQESLKGTS